MSYDDILEIMLHTNVSTQFTLALQTYGNLHNIAKSYIFQITSLIQRMKLITSILIMCKSVKLKNEMLNLKTHTLAFVEHIGFYCEARHGHFKDAMSVFWNIYQILQYVKCPK